MINIVKKSVSVFLVALIATQSLNSFADEKLNQLETRVEVLEKALAIKEWYCLSFCGFIGRIRRGRHYSVMKYHINELKFIDVAGRGKTAEAAFGEMKKACSEISVNEINEWHDHYKANDPPSLTLFKSFTTNEAGYPKVLIPSDLSCCVPQ